MERILPTFQTFPEATTVEQRNAIEIQGAEEFLEANPSFYGSRRNANHLRDFCHLRGVLCSRFNLEVAFNAIGDQLEQRPAEIDDEPTEVVVSRFHPKTEAELQLLAEAKVSRQVEEAEIRALSPIPASKNARFTGKSQVAPISKSLAAAYHESLNSRKQEAVDTGSRLRDARIAVANSNPELYDAGRGHGESPEFKKAVSEYLESQ